MDINRLISLILRIGVIASMVLSLYGLAAWVASGAGGIAIISGSRIASTILSAFQGSPSGLIYLGVMVLIATPIFRVGLSAAYFAREKDGKYVLITMVVLSMLFFALLSGSAI